jgi:hypothetical protein
LARSVAIEESSLVANAGKADRIGVSWVCQGCGKALGRVGRSRGVELGCQRRQRLAKAGRLEAVLFLRILQDVGKALG